MEKEMNEGINEEKVEAAVQEASDAEAKAASGQEGTTVYRKNRFGLCVPEDYEVNAMGLTVYKFYRKNPVPKKICPRIEVKGIGVFNRNEDRCDPAILTQFESAKLGKEVTYAMKLSDITADAAVCAKGLADMGFGIKPKNRQDLMDYLVDSYNIQENRESLCLFASQPGWIESSACYVLPDRVYGGSGDIVPAIPNVNGEYQQKGTLEEWKKNVAEYAKGNPIFQFALAVSFGSVLMRPFGVTTGFIYHLYGDSSSGKNVAQRLAQSVWHRGGSFRSWSATDNGPEATMVFFNNNVCVLEELGQFAKTFKGDLGKKIYEMSNGKGKMRMTASLQQQKVAMWHATILSSGEHSVPDEMILNGKKPTAGENVRSPSIPASLEDVRDLHGKKDSKDLVEWLEKQTDRFYGTAGPAFLVWLLADGGRALDEAVKSDLKQKCCDELLRDHPDAGTQVKRQTDGFAVLLAAGRMVKNSGLLDFDFDEGVKYAYEQFIAGLGGVENNEERDIVEAVEDYIDRREYSDFMPLECDGDDLRVKDGKFVANCSGFKFEPEGHYYFYNSFLFKKLLSGYKPSFAKKVLVENGMIVPPAKAKYSFGVNNQKQMTIVKLRDRKPVVPQEKELQEAVDPETGEVTTVSKPSAEGRRQGLPKHI